MKVLLVTDSFYPCINGVSTFVKSLALGLDKKGHEIVILATSPFRALERTKIGGVEIFGVPTMPSFLDPDIRIPVSFGLKGKIIDLLEMFNPDVIHILDSHYLSALTVTVNRRFKIPLIATIYYLPEHLNGFLKNTSLKRSLETLFWQKYSRILNQVQIITSPSISLSRLISNKLNIKAEVISSGVDLRRFNPGLKNEFVLKKYKLQAKPYLLYAGYLDPFKNLELVLTAFKMAVTQVPFTLVITGDGRNESRLKKICNRLGLKDKVLFTGFVTDENLPALYAQACGFIINNTAEGQRIATLEAMASGLPILARKESELEDLVQPNHNGFLFEGEDPGTLAAFMIKILLCPEIRREMGTSSVEKIREHNIETVVEKFEEVYKKLSDRNHLGEVQDMDASKRINISL
ncbi:MAG TPA: glycosyltransferase [Flavisolibacter sp.]|nr:glycosyltransferase [Flavisolibacter sp.]